MKARPERRTYSVPETAALLGVSTDTVRREIRAGRLPGFQLGGKGGRVVVPRAPLDELLQGKSA